MRYLMLTVPPSTQMSGTLAFEPSAIEVLHGIVHPDGEMGGSSHEYQLPDVHRTKWGGQLLHSSVSGHLNLISSHAMPACLDATLLTMAE